MGKLTLLFLLGGLLAPGLALDVNHATEAELDGLRGLGPAFTRRILAERSLRPFADWPDLMRRVSGMGGVTAQKLSAQGLTVQNQPLKQKPIAVEP
ncbi:MAG: helix-hairpin-helix domain-containing protein [Betaproteobacteria bacterium]|nr:helix-hairpin-helix domain-containing protein [Betaproteobacteria bacterium]NDF05297.1 helix-hairpin-helix domain-containing protein [Betaproteobacteria bacterium]